MDDEELPKSVFPAMTGEETVDLWLEDNSLCQSWRPKQPDDGYCQCCLDAGHPGQHQCACGAKWE